jgi:hypothetical protein
MTTEKILSSFKLELPLFTDKKIFEHIKMHKKYILYCRKRKEIFAVKNILKELIGRIEREFLEISEDVKVKGLKCLKQEELLKKRRMVRNWKQEKILRVTVQDDGWSREKEMLDFARRQNEEKNCKKRQEIGRQVRAYREQKEVRRIREDEERARAEEDRERNKVRLTQEDRRRLKGKKLASFMHKMNPILEKINRKEAAEQKKENLQQQYRSKFATLPSKFLEGTESYGLKVRDKFSPSREKGKFADNLAGNVVRTTGRAMVGWRAAMF